MAIKMNLTTNVKGLNAKTVKVYVTNWKQLDEYLIDSSWFPNPNGSAIVEESTMYKDSFSLKVEVFSFTDNGEIELDENNEPISGNAWIRIPEWFIKESNAKAGLKVKYSEIVCTDLKNRKTGKECTVCRW